MNSFVTIGLLVISLIVGQSFAIKESCRTCRGAACSQEDVLQLECTKFVPALPFESQLLINNNVGDLKYGCLSLEYLINDTPDRIEQCILTTDLESFCGSLDYSLNVKQCSVEAIDGSRIVRSVSANEAAVQEGEDPPVETTTPEPTTTTDEPTTTSIETTTSHASAIHLTSLFSFLGLLAMLIL